MTETDSSRSTDAVIAEYERTRPLYVRFAERLAALMEQLLDEAEVKVHAIEKRAKDIDSFRAKITRPEKHYDVPLRDVTDLTGLRIIVYDLADLSQVNDLLWREFSVDPAESHDTRRSLKPNEFGYQSIHYVISLEPGRSVLPEWRLFAGLRAEIQARTVLQHAWASLSHALQYKNPIDTSPELARKLFRVSGLLELADEELSTIRSRGFVLASRAAAAIESGNLDVAISRSALKAYTSASDVARDLVRSGTAAGFTISDDDEAPWEDAIGDLAKVCAYAELTSVRELDDLCRRQLQRADTFFRALMASETEWGGDVPFFLILTIILGRPQTFTADSLVQLGWARGIAERVKAVATKFKAA